jgi:hypothetical protein
VNITLSIDDEILQQARRRAEALGTSVNQLVRNYLEQFAGKRDPAAIAAELKRLSLLARGDRRGWKFIRNEIYQRGS